MHPDEVALYLGDASLFWWQHAMNYLHRYQMNSFHQQLDGECNSRCWILDYRCQRVTSMDTFTASDLR